MLITCVSGTLLYSRDSPVGILASLALRSLLIGTAVAIATFLIITFSTWTEIRRS